MRRHREAMRFVAHHLQELQRRLVTIEANRLVAIGNVDFLFALRQSRDREAFDAETIERFKRDGVI